MLIDYILYLRDEKQGKKLARSSIKVHLAAVLHFFQINNDDFNLTMRHFRMHIPSDEFDYRHDDRAYSHKEILQILTACDARVRMMILLLCSSGTRIGALRSLQIGDLIQTETTFNSLNFKVYKILVYARTRDRCITFCSPECYTVIQEYLEYRRKSGETLNDKAPLIREQFNIDNPFTTNVPKPLSEHGVWYTVERAIKKSAVYDQCKEDGVYLSHGMRKFFKTQCEQAGMKSLHVEMLLGHNVGLASNYYRPSEFDLLEDYMTHAAESLTIDPTFRLQKQVTRLKTERTEEIDRLKAELAKLREENQESATTIDEHNLVLKNLNDNFKKQQAERDK
jgi:integrase